MTYDEVLEALGKELDLKVVRARARGQVRTCTVCHTYDYVLDLTIRGGWVYYVCPDRVACRERVLKQKQAVVDATTLVALDTL